jgi:endoglucanase
MALNEALLKRLIETPSVSGREEQQREIARDELGDLTDEVRTDVMGSVIGTKRGNSDVRVMIAAHTDDPPRRAPAVAQATASVARRGAETAEGR